MKKIDFSSAEKPGSYTEKRNCPLCKSKRSKSFLRFDNFQFLTDSPEYSKTVDIDIHMCDECETIFNNPVYTDIGFNNLFSEMAHSYGMTEGRTLEQIDYLNEIGVLDNTRSVLDLGCYRGEFLSHFPDNLEKDGIDIDLPSISLAKQQFPKANFFCQDLEKFNTGKKYDLIVMLHVLEHLKNPLEVLINILNSSHKDTYLLIEVPILENGFTNDVNGFFSAQHLTHFSRNSLKNFFKHAGWEIIRLDEQPSYNGTRVIAKPSLKKHMKYVPEITEDTGILYSYLRHWYNILQDVEEKLKRSSENNKFIIWGAGLHTEFLFNKTSFFRKNKELEFLFFDSDPAKIGRTYRGVQIVPPFTNMKKSYFDTPIVLSSYRGTESMKVECIKHGWDEDKIISFYDYYSLY